jgi:serine/threonine protein phosphatase PrpC
MGAKCVHEQCPKNNFSLAYTIEAGSDPGKRSKYNEDRVFAASSRGDTTSPYGLFVVADGMGGYSDGQVASFSAIQAIVDSLWTKLGNFNKLPDKTCTMLLAEAVQKANAAVHQQNIDLESRVGAHMMEDMSLSTTLTAAMLIGSTTYIANVGDCRAYRYRAKERLEKITTDHLLVARWIEEGTLTPEAIYTHPHRNILYRALPSLPQVEVDLFAVPLQPGDVLLLCSRNLWSVVHDREMEEVIRSAPVNPSRVASELVQSALDRSGRDNISAIVVSIRE